MEYTSSDVEALTGLSNRQVHYLVMNEALKPKTPGGVRGSGHAFTFDEQEVAIAAAVACARSLGMPVEIIVIFAERLRQTPAVLWTPSVLVMLDGTVRSKDDAEARHASGWSINLHEARATVPNTL